ncbi:coiled-coil domain-containing protein 177-like [Pecten maximus]|uniref:coiled-coil domain-containing protein 177-like n=1 Tax=Pecten maximus TaxID=6579 RepID=UPI001459149F|nr:coiled-coil domain-containing protein 177-like [Pecten maximus]
MDPSYLSEAANESPRVSQLASQLNELKIDLYNFEDPHYEDGKYVLTSPRSLEACAKLGVKPVDLLYKPLAEFQEELLPQDVPLRTIYNIYDDHEQQRQLKLKTARDERNKLKDQENQVRNRNKKLNSGNKYSGLAKKSLRKSRLFKSNSDEDLSQVRGSIQRQRTAWATSVGHKRVSDTDINKRANELHEESLKLRNELLSKKDRIRPRPWLSPFQSKLVECVKLRMFTILMLIPYIHFLRANELHEESLKLRNELLSKKDRIRPRPKSAQSGRIKRKGTGRSSVARSRSRSTSNLSLNSSSGSCLLNKSSVKDARPISNPSLRKTLSSSSVDLRSTCITPRGLSCKTKPPQDEKILELMMSKGEEEKAVSRDRYMADLAWDLQRKREEEAKIVSEMRRRELLAEENRIRHRRMVETEKQRLEVEAELLEARERKLKESSAQWKRSSNIQLTMRNMKLAEMKEKEQLKKLSQERNRQLMEHDENEMNDLVLEKHRHDIHTAAQRKEAKLFQESMKKVMENRSKRDTFEDRRKLIDDLAEQDQDYMKNSIHKRHSSAEVNLHLAAQQKENELRMSQLEREKKALSAKLSQKKLDQELEEWRSSVKNHRKAAERHASEVNARNTDMKARKAHEERVQREQAQKNSIKKIHKEVETWRKETEADLLWKDRKANAVLQDKEVTIQQSRHVAHQSSKLRHELKEKYGAESFDKKAFRVELFHQIGLGHLSNKKAV